MIKKLDLDGDVFLGHTGQVHGQLEVVFGLADVRLHEADVGLGSRLSAIEEGVERAHHEIVVHVLTRRYQHGHHLRYSRAWLLCFFLIPVIISAFSRVNAGVLTVARASSYVTIP